MLTGSIITLTLYAIGLLFVILYHKLLVLDDTHKPNWMKVGEHSSFYFIAIVKMLLAYGSALAVFYFYGIWYGIVALVLLILISKLSFRYFFNREVRQEAAIHIEMMGGEPPDTPEYRKAVGELQKLMGETMGGEWVEKTDADVRAEAYDIARHRVRQRLEGTLYENK